MLEQILFIDFNSFFRILLSAPLLYLTIIIMVRISGKRTSSHMNNFDWIIVVAMGSLVASGIMTKDASILDVIFSIGLLLGFQYILTWSIIRSERIAKLVKATPRLLVYQGEYLETALRKERVTKREILSALREQGIHTLEEVEAVVLEADAAFSILRKNNNESKIAQTLTGVKGFSSEKSGLQ